MLVGCGIELSNMDASYGVLKRLYFVDSPQEGFWRGEPLTSSGMQLGWVHFNSSHSDPVPVFFEAGMDGYYFELNAGGDNALKRYQSLSICPTKTATGHRCRHFSLKGFSAAVMYVCNRQL
jgi:hypothetical protein